MKKLELDLNKLSDEQLRKYLELKDSLGIIEPDEVEPEKVQRPSTQIVDEKARVIFRRPKKYKKSKRYKRANKEWVSRVEKLEKFLKKPRRIMEMFTHLDYKQQGGGDYKTIRRHLKMVYGKCLKILQEGKTKFYYVSKDKTVVSVPIPETSSRTILKWTKPMEKDLIAFKSSGLTHEEAKEEMSKKYDLDFRIKQIEMKVYNLKAEGKWKVPKIKLELPKEKPKHKEYMIRKNPYFIWKNKYLKKVMMVHGMSVQDATRYLSATWMGSAKSPEKASEKVTFELGTEMIEPEVEPERTGPPVKFPPLKCLKPRMGKVLVDMIKNMVHRPELKLSFEPEGRLLGIDYYHEWQDFCRDFLEKSSKIATYMRLQDKFILVGFGKNGMAIQYR